MLKKLIAYFTHHHLLTNIILVGVLFGGGYYWEHSQKEEMPNFSFDTLRISASYPGASASEVEHFVTNPIEEAVKDLDGVSSVKSSTNTGRTSISLELNMPKQERAEVVNNIKSTVLSLRLPEAMRDEPRFRQFKSSSKAIIDIFLYDTNHHLLGTKERVKLQNLTKSLESQLLSLPQVGSISRRGYLDEEIRVIVNPEKSQRYQISQQHILSEIRKNNLRAPVGSLEDKSETKLTLLAELESKKDLENLTIQGGFSGRFIRLKDVATIEHGFEKNTSITKANGFEAIQLNIVKSSDAGILESTDAVIARVKQFNKIQLKGSSIKLITLDDESTSVRNRINIIVQNGLIGFILIIGILFIFLNFKSGIWVAIGIPFTICFTLIAGSWIGLTINNVTLAGIIVVMGMVVDDAIVVAENISRQRSNGVNSETASIEGAHFVFRPILASIITTCLAFLPILFFQGKISKIIITMPIVIFLMLGASLFESTLILPGHLHLSRPSWLTKFFPKKATTPHWFYAVEDWYGKLLEKILHHKGIVLITFIAFFLIAIGIFKTSLKFVMFPNEETTEIRLTAMTDPTSTRFDTALKAKEMEQIIDRYLGKEVVGYRTDIAKSRRGGAARENKFRMRIEIIPKDQRDKSSKQLSKEWKKQFNSLSGFKKIRFSKHRFGQSSGSPIELIILENNDDKRQAIAEEIQTFLEANTNIKNVEIESPLVIPEYIITLKRRQIKRLGVNPESVASTFKSILDGSTIYTLKRDGEEIDVKLTTTLKKRSDIKAVLSIPVANQQGYLVPLHNLVSVTKTRSKSSIDHEHQKRTTSVFADMADDTTLTPLNLAATIEKDLLPALLKDYPLSTIQLGGEIRDSRESGKDFKMGLIMVLLLIYTVLVLLFNSLLLPLVIMFSIPFGVIGVIIAFKLHGIHNFGFFTIIGLLGLSGVVVNDAIVMVAKLNYEAEREPEKHLSEGEISNIAKTRLSAVVLTTLTTVAGLFPTAYGVAGYDSMLAEMMLAMGWGLLFATLITLVLIPALFYLSQDILRVLKKLKGSLS